MHTVLTLHSALEGDLEADLAPGDSEFDTLGLGDFHNLHLSRKL